MYIALLFAALLFSVFLLTELHLQLPIQIAPIRNRPLGPQGVAYDTRVIPDSARISSVNRQANRSFPALRLNVLTNVLPDSVAHFL